MVHGTDLDGARDGADVASRASRGRGVGARGCTGYAPIGDAPEVLEERVRVWRAPPDRVREEREGSYGASVAARRGRRWWRYAEQNGAISKEGAPEERGTGLR